MSRPPLQYRIVAFFGRLAGRIGDGWHWLVGPVERLFGRVGEGALGALDSFEGLESAVVGVLRIIFWPVIVVFSLVGRWLPTGGEAGPGLFGRTFGRLGHALYRLAESFNLDGVVRLFAWLLTPIWWPIGQLLGFTNAWLATRAPRELALATPAVLAVVPFAFITLQGAWLGQDRIAERYKVAVRDAVEAGEYTQVDLLERKLAQLGVDTRRRDYRTALALESDGKLGAAYQRMVRLGPVERPGYPSAHVWIAQRLLNGDLTEEHEPAIAESETARYELTEVHLDRLAELEITGAGVSSLRAFVFARTGREREAEQALKPFANRDVGAAVMRMRLLANLRDMEPARTQAKRVAEMMANLPRADRANEDNFLAWALAAELLKDNRQMEAALTAWHTAAPDSRRPRELLGQYRQEQAVRLMKDPTASPDRAAAVLAEATELSDSLTWANAQAVYLFSSNSRQARQVLDRLRDHPDAPPLLVQSLATAAAGAGRIEASRLLFKRLVDQGTENGLVWNNYAWALIQDPNPDPEAALLAVEKALETSPKDYRFRETRGQVKIALGLWDEAVVDLEYALNGLPESQEVHRSLAVAYDALDKPTLAKIHRRQASE